MNLPPLPPRPRILVSALFYYREELAENFVARLQPQLCRAADSLHAVIRLRLTLNYPDPGEIWQKIAREFAPANPRVSLEIHRPGWNLGFGKGHNHALLQSACDVVVVLNSDLFCTAEDWLGDVIRAFHADPAVALVGAVENASWLREDGCGIQISEAHAHYDFIDGSILGIRADAIDRLGLFSSDFPFFYFEDVDLCLRVQQAGLRVAAVPIPHEHLRHGSSKKLPRYLVGSILSENRDRFFRKWGRFLETKTLTNRIAIDLREATGEEFLAATAVVSQLRQAHPTAELVVCPPLSADISLVSRLGRVQFSPQPPETWDRLVRAPLSQLGARVPAVLELARDAGVDLTPQAVAAPLRAIVRSQRLAQSGVAGAPDPRRALINFPTADLKVAGRVPDPAIYTRLVFALVEAGYTVEGIADEPESGHLDWFRPAHRVHPRPATALEAAELLLDAALFLSPSDPLLIVAQLLAVRTLAVFGAKSALREIFAPASTGVFYAPQLDCLGCQPRLGTASRNICIRRDLACVAASQDVELAKTAAGFLLNGKSQLEQAVEVELRLYSRPQRPSADLDLSAWPEE